MSFETFTLQTADLRSVTVSGPDKGTVFGTVASPSIPQVCGQMASVIVEAGSEWLGQAASAVCEIFLDTPSAILTFRERAGIVAAKLRPNVGDDNESLMGDPAP